jgi:hypothetical protein
MIAANGSVAGKSKCVAISGGTAWPYGVRRRDGRMEVQGMSVMHQMQSPQPRKKKPDRGDYIETHLNRPSTGTTDSGHGHHGQRGQYGSAHR